MASKGGGGESLDQVRAERDQLVKNKRTYQQRIRQLEEEVEGVVAQSQELSTENGQLRQQVDALQSSGGGGGGGGAQGASGGGSRQVEEQLKKEIQELTAMVAKTTGEKQQLEFDNESLQSRLSLMEGRTGQNASTDNQKVKAKQGELEKCIQELEKDRQRLEKDKQVLEKEKQRLERDKQGLQDKLSKSKTAQTENTQFESETKNKTLERTVKNLEAENKELVERMEQKRSELDELMREMQTDTKNDKDLKEASQELEVANRKIEDVKNELIEVKRRNETLEKKNDSTKGMLRLKDSESKGVKANSENKDTQITELKRQVDSLERNVKRLETDVEEAKHLEKDTASMKARIRSLKTEIEDSLTANQKMKEERAEAKLQAERLNRELVTSSEALTESRRLLKKLEGDRDSKGKLEQELKLCKERAAGLERSTREMSDRKEKWKKKMEEEIKGRKIRELELESDLNDLKMKNEQLKKKLQATEKNQENVGNSHAALRDQDALNKKLTEENKRLRQTVAERNMEITQHQSERSLMVKRMDTLERQQMDPGMRQQQQQQPLKGWVDNAKNMYASVPAPSQYSSHPQHVISRPPPGPSSSSHPPRREAPVTNPHPGRSEGSYTQLHHAKSEGSVPYAQAARNGVAVPAHPSQVGSEGGVRRRKRGHVQQDRQNQLNRSWEDMHRMRQEPPRQAEYDESSRATPGSLPIILDSKILPTTGPTGYFDLYRNKMKLIRERKW